MNTLQRNTIYIVFLLIFTALAIYNLILGSQWFIDSVISVLLLSIAVFISRWVGAKASELVMFNIIIVIHDLGSFGFYNFHYGLLYYDHIIHFLGGLLGAYIFFNVIARKLNTLKHERVGRTCVEDHKLMLAFFVISIVLMLGLVVEITEFVGYTYLGAGEGMMFVGAGDSDNIADIAGQYIDTMQDIIANMAGAVISVLFCFAIYRKR